MPVRRGVIRRAFVASWSFAPILPCGPATGEVVGILEWPECARRHGLRVIRGYWPASSAYPIVEVEISGQAIDGGAA